MQVDIVLVVAAAIATGRHAMKGDGLDMLQRELPFWNIYVARDFMLKPEQQTHTSSLRLLNYMGKFDLPVANTEAEAQTQALHPPLQAHNAPRALQCRQCQRPAHAFRA